MGALFFVCGFSLSALSTALAIGVRIRAPKGSTERMRTWKIWLSAHALFIVGTIGTALLIHARLN